MKVLQTLGKHSGATEGIFAYRRDSGGVYIDASVGHAKLPSPVVRLSSAEWDAILSHLAKEKGHAFRLTGKKPFKVGPKKSLYELISTAVPSPATGWSWMDSLKACICAILEHEGSIDFYHGVLGKGVSVVVCVKPDA